LVSLFQCSFGKDKRGLTVLKNMAIAQKLGSVMVAGLMVLTAGVAAAAPASAATTCHNWLEKREVAGQNQVRAGAICTDMGSNDRVRLVLVRESLPNRYSPWLIENTAYSTGWVTCPSVCDAFLEARIG
jgi:hypothetical protein